MIENIEIQNFRCFRHLNVPLMPLTVLIGANDTGKSTFLEAVRLCLSSSGKMDPADAFLNKPADQIFIEIRLEAGVARLDLIQQIDHPRQPRWTPRQEPTGGCRGGRGPARNPVDRHNVVYFRLPASGVQMESSAIPDLLGFPEFAEDGSNVPGFIDYVLRRDRKRFFQLTESLRSLIPGFNDLDIGTPSLERRRIDLAIEDGFTIPADSASSGLRLLIFFAALALHPHPPDIILIEEPENGIHPGRLGNVMNLLRKITLGENGLHAAQVILTTHSPYLLDSVDLETDQVLVFRREPDGSRTAEPADRERLKVFLHEFMLGEIWINQGEEALVAKPS